MEPDGGDSLEAIGQWVAELRKEQGVRSQSALARELHLTPPVINKVERGVLLSPLTAKILDDRLGVGGAISERLRRLKASQSGGAPEGGGATDRRQALMASGLAPAAFAAELSDRMAWADPRPLTLREYEADVVRVSSAYRVTPNGDLLPHLESKWLEVVRLLERPWLSGPVRDRLALVAGQYAGWLAESTFEVGGDAAPWLVVGGQLAAVSGDQRLMDSIAVLDVSISLFTGQYELAADTAAAARRSAHPYVRSYLAGREAQSAALSGQPERARRALGDMQDTLWSGPPMPGPAEWTADDVTGCLAGVSGQLGDGEAAETHARRSLAVLDGTGQYIEVAGTYNILARSHLKRRNPDPEQAADAARRAWATLGGHPARTVAASTRRLWLDMSARWPDLPAVRELGEALRSTRRALPPVVPKRGQA